MSAALTEARKLALDELEGIAARGATAPLTDADTARFDELEAEVADLDKRAAMAAKANELRASQPAPAEPAEGRSIAAVAKAPTAAAVEVRETSPYAADARNQSWFADVRAVRDRQSSDREVNEARERLVKHYAASGDEGSAREARALTTTTASEGGYLAAPAYLQDQFARMLVAGATTTQLVSKLPLPPKTTQIYIPQMTTATAVAVHTQNAALQETSAAFSQVACTALRYGGAQTIPNFLLERSLPGVDQVVLGDLSRQLAKKINTDIVGGTGTGTTAIEGILNADSIGTATATATTATWSDVYPALVNAVMDVNTSHFMGPDAIVMHPRRWGWVLAQLDGDKRPLIGAVNPQNAIADYTSGVGPEGLAPARSVGSILGIPVYLDSTIGTTNGAGTDEDQIIVGAFKEAMLFQAAPMFGVSTEAEFLKDQTLVRVTQDVAFTAERYPGAFSVVSGTALNDL